MLTKAAILISALCMGTPWVFAVGDPHCRLIATQSSVEPIQAGLDTRLLAAIEGNDAQVIDELVWVGVSPDRFAGTSYYGRAKTIRAYLQLVSAAASGDERTLRESLRHGIDPNANYHIDNSLTPLIWASRCGQTSIVRTLVSMGANPNETSTYYIDGVLMEGTTALIWAAASGEEDVVNTLLKAGADPRARELRSQDKEPGRDALWAARHAPLIDVLISHGAVVDTRQNDGSTKLMQMAAAGDLDSCRVLLERGADPRLKNRHGKSAIDIAIAANHTAVARLLEKSVSKW